MGGGGDGLGEGVGDDGGASLIIIKKNDLQGFFFFFLGLATSCSSFILQLNHPNNANERT